jgi:hypothetical protein
MLKVTSVEQAMGRTQVFEWFAKFKNSVIPHTQHIQAASKTGENLYQASEGICAREQKNCCA